jgi:trimeric autotransporter adhesin
MQSPTTALFRRLVVACLATLAFDGAHADNPTTGASLYASHCASCHGNSPLTSNGSKIYFGRNARGVIETAIATNNSGMGALRPTFPTNGTQIADVAAYLGNSPSTLTFPSTNVGVTSPSTQTVTVAASLKGASYAISGLTVAATGDFARTGGTCGTAVAAGTSCTVIVSFTPTAAGTRSGTLSLAHNNTLAPVTIALGGTATSSAPAPAPVATISPSSVALADTPVGATSAVQNVTVGNTGTAALTLSALSLSNSADFGIAGGTCAVGTSVAAGSSCTVSLAFHPASGGTGARSGALSVGHNAVGSPGSVSMSGNATAAAAPVASITASLNFGSVNVGATSTAQTATLSNTGSAPLAIGTLSTGSGEFVVGGGTCSAGGALAAGSSCSVNVSFAPAAAGARSGALTITHNAAGGSSGSSLSGTGVALTPVFGMSPSMLGFTQTVGTTSAAQTATISNTGTAALLLSAITIGGAQASEYQLAGGSSCVAGGTVAAGASCALNIAFAPTTAGTRSASVSISHNASGSPATLALNGNATATPQPAISLNATSLAFAGQTIGTTSAAQSLVVTNSGAAPLTLSALALAGTTASDFTRSGTCSTGVALAAGATCTAAFTFTPGAVGARSATLTITSNASNGAASLGLSGSGAAVATPAVSLSTATLAFGNQTVGTVSAARTATLTNSGSGGLSLASVIATAGFGVAHNCGTSVAAGASCTLSATFAPTAAGAVSGSLSIASNATGSPHVISLGGSGVVASPVLAWAPVTTALAFGDLAVGAAPTSRTITLTNQGPGSVTLQAFTLAGAHATDFSIGAGSTCAANLALAASSSCTVAVAFQPAAVGARNAMLQVTSSGTNPPDVVLAGNGSAMAQPAIGVAPSAVALTLASGAGTVDPQVLTLQNAGNAVLRVTAARIASGSFTLGAAASGACSTMPFDLMPGQACGFAVGWSGAPPNGTETGSLEIDSNAAATPMVVALSATRALAAGAAPPATSTPAASPSNAGAGGCSISEGNSLADPTLWLLTLLAIGVLLSRRAGH